MAARNVQGPLDGSPLLTWTVPHMPSPGTGSPASPVLFTMNVAAVAETTNTHALLLPAVKAAFEELTAKGYGDSDIAVTRRFIGER